MHRILALLLLACPLLSGCGKAPESAEKVKDKDTGNAKGIAIGFLVKRPEEKWFQDEWRFAQQCADQRGFKLIKIGASDGEKVLAAIDNLAAQGAQGFVICTPDVKLGPAIVAKAKNNGLKVLTVDDQLVGPDGKFMDVPYLGISARKIGEAVGQSLWDEMKRRGWAVGETAACAITFDELETCRERTEGAIAALQAAGFPADRIHRGAEKTTDTEGSFNAADIVLTQHPDVKRWLVFSVNDEGVLGAVRSMAERKLDAGHVIGVGIGGSAGIEEFHKEKPTGFFASILLETRRHGFDTVDLMYRWIKEGVAPPPVTYTVGTLVTRENYEQVLRDQGLDE
jgi:L-arabinose transport system substrate-binding protein